MEPVLQKKISYDSFVIAELYHRRCNFDISGSKKYEFYKANYLFLPDTIGPGKDPFYLLQVKKDFDTADKAELTVMNSFVAYCRIIRAISAENKSAVYETDLFENTTIVDLALPIYTTKQNWLEVKYNDILIGLIRNNIKGFKELDGQINKSRFATVYNFVNYEWAVANKLFQKREPKSLIDAYNYLVEDFELFAQRMSIVNA